MIKAICEKRNEWDSPFPRRISLSGTGSVGYGLVSSIRDASQISQVDPVANYGIVNPIKPCCRR